MNKTIYVSDRAIWEAAKAKAQAQGESMSVLISRLLRDYVR